MSCKEGPSVALPLSPTTYYSYSYYYCLSTAHPFILACPSLNLWFIHIVLCTIYYKEEGEKKSCFRMTLKLCYNEEKVYSNHPKHPCYTNTDR